MAIKFENIRREYKQHSLLIEDLDNNPFILLEKWLTDITHTTIPDPTVFTLTTVSQEGQPYSRNVLLKHFSNDGFTFFTRYSSRKGTHIQSNNHVALLFYDCVNERQIHIRGKAFKIPRKETVKYFKSRPKDSQIGALVSNQSTAIPNRSYLEDLFDKAKEDYHEKEVPCPDNWGGYIVKPEEFEFWQGRPNRLHDRIEFIIQDSSWEMKRLAP